MKIIFIGTVNFSRAALEKLVQINAEVVGVCTKKKSKFNSDFNNLAPFCIKNKIPFKYVKDINAQENIKWIEKFNPDIIFCFGWSNLLKKKILRLANMGVVGFHPTNLPLNRGRHPIIWSLVLGLKNSASTFFFMNESADSGPILSQIPFKISKNDNAKSLYEKITNFALKQIEIFVPLLQKNKFKKKKQDHKKSNIWRKRTFEDGKIDFRMCSEDIYNLVRGLSKPYDGAHVSYKGIIVPIWKTKIIKKNFKNIECGKILNTRGKQILVKTSNGAIQIIEHGFKRMPKNGEYF